MRKYLLDMRKDFLIMTNFYLVEILSKPNSLTIVTSKKIVIMSNYVLILSIFFLITRIRNLQCNHLYNNQFLEDAATFYRKTDAFKYPFFPSTMLEWNKLNTKIRQSSTMLIFRIVVSLNSNRIVAY